MPFSMRESLGSSSKRGNVDYEAPYLWRGTTVYYVSMASVAKHGDKGLIVAGGFYGYAVA